MRLGMPLPSHDDPGAGLAWATAHGLGAVYVEERWCPDEASARAYGQRIRAAGLVAAELGAWCNPLDTDAVARQLALERCQRLLALADAAEARCCVNIAGSLGPKWDGPFAADLAPEAFERIVASVRAIVDAVKPRRTTYVLETMPWMLPDSVASYQALLIAIDRPCVAVHFDLVNLINSPRLYFDHAPLIAEFVAVLGSRIRSVHIKDVRLRDHLTLHLDECRPGTGALDHGMLLRALSRLDADLPCLLEHCPSTEDYLLGVAHLTRCAKQQRLTFIAAKGNQPALQTDAGTRPG